MLWNIFPKSDKNMDIIELTSSEKILECIFTDNIIFFNGDDINFKGIIENNKIILYKQFNH